MLPSIDSYPSKPRALSAGCLSVLLLSACGGEVRDPPAIKQPASSLRMVACDQALSGADAACGILRVPENRHRSDSGMIELPFMVLRAARTDSPGEPAILLGGGPGPSIVAALGALPVAQLTALPLRQARDLVVLEQRGAPLTAPRTLDCPELLGEPGAMPGFRSTSAATEAAAACRSRLENSGIQLAAYNTVETAADIEELQTLLSQGNHYRKWHIAATSYGTRVAQALLARQRFKVATVVLDGPLPLTAKALHSAGLLDAIDALADACSGLPDCAQAFDGMRQRAEAGLTALLARQPIGVGGAQVDVERVTRQLRALLSNGDLARSLAALDALGRQDWGGLAGVLALDQVPAVMPTPSGLFHAVMCADEPVSSQNPQTLPAEGGAWPDAIRLATARASAFPAPAICRAWGGGTAALPAPVTRAEVPMLVIAGQLDPITPPAHYGRHLRPYFPMSRLLVVPLQGHGLLESLPCVQSAAAAFQQRPTQTVALDCGIPD